MQYPITWELLCDCEMFDDCSTPSEPFEVTIDLVMLVWQLMPSCVLVLDWKIWMESQVAVALATLR